MPLLSFDTLDLVPDDLRPFAKPIEGANGRVNVNVVPSVKIDEFRDNNIKLSKERDTLLAQIEPLKAIVGEDAATFTTNLDELRDIARRVKDGELKETRQVDETVAKRTEEMRKDYDKQLLAVNKEKVSWQQQHRELEATHKRTLVANALQNAAMQSDSGVEPKAVEDIVDNGLKVFKVDDHGRIIPMEGDAPLYGQDGVTPMTPKEWLTRLKEVKPHFFKGSHGGGAGGDSTTKKVLGVDPKQIAKMSASERLALANGEKVARR